MTPNKWINICSLSNTILSVEPNDPSETATWLIARPNAENARSPGTGLANVAELYMKGLCSIYKVVDFNLANKSIQVGCG